MVDDQELFRQGMKTVLEAEGLEIVGEAAHGADALWLVQATRPDLVLMDLRMPHMDGVEATRRIRARYAEIPVLVLTTFDEDVLVFDALRAGAAGYLLKGLPGKKLVEAVQQTLEGASVLTPSIGRKVVSEFVRMAHRVPQATSKDFGLSRRETQVLSQVALGRSNKEIAHVLGVAEGTIKNHVSRVLEKLEVSSRTEAALLAREHGVVG
ncbi:MAG: response regulator transcription factor [Myxococcota bacterium]